MSFTWTPHRFAGGALALDVANSVVTRGDPQRRVDRYADASALEEFAHAANAHCAERDLAGGLVPVVPERRSAFIALREAIDGHFRAAAAGVGTPERMANLLEAIAGTLRGAGHNAASLETATAHSALRLSASAEPDRLKICPNCGWLFLDRSRNRSRAWCDMAVCGNRAKASRHYYRRREESRT